MQDVVDAVHAFTIVHGMITSVVSGGAAGADTHAAVYASTFGVPVTVHAPDWATHGKSAGYKRNVLIVNDAEAVLAVWDGVSKGTLLTMNIARDQGKLLVCHRTRSSNASP